MQIEVAILISGLTMAFSIYSVIASLKRRYKADNRKDGAEMMMVIVKLEGISEGITEIKAELSHVKSDIKEITERLIVAEQSVKMAHKRLNELHGNVTHTKEKGDK